MKKAGKHKNIVLNNANIQKIYANGNKAYILFKKYYSKDIEKNIDKINEVSKSLSNTSKDLDNIISKIKEEFFNQIILPQKWEKCKGI